MILTNREFKREKPSREAKNIYIFSEGLKREYQYFQYFKEMDSRINIEVYKLHSTENNSPLGLLNIAKKCIDGDENTKPKYNFLKGDEVWIVLDADKDKLDSRKPQIKEIEKYCKGKEGWSLAQSNPCFEVWLYYHFFNSLSELGKEDEKCSTWKFLVNSKVNGGFDSRRHPIYIEKAKENAENNYSEIKDTPTIGSTNIYKLADSIIPLIKEKLNRVKRMLQEG